MSRLFNGKKMMILFSSMILSLSVLLICLNTIANVLESENAAIISKSGKYRVSLVKTKLAALDKEVAKINPPYMEKAEARRFITETAENIKNLYNGRYMSVIRDEDSSISIDMNFTVSPSSPADITKIVDYFESSVAPIFFIRKFSTSVQQNEKKVEFRITLTQPYYGGSYVY